MDKELYISDEIKEKTEEAMDDVSISEEKGLIIEEIINGVSYNAYGETNEEIVDEISEEIVEAISDMPIIIPSDLEVPAEKIAKSKQRAEIERLYNKKPPKKKKANPFWRALLVIIFLIIIYFAISNIFINKEIDASISIDINPSIEIEINSKNKVLNIIALNSDAKKIIQNIKYKGEKIEDVMTEIFLSLSDRIYINEENDIMLLSIAAQTGRRAETIKKLAFNTVVKVFSNKSIKPRVIRQSFVIDENIEREAKKYQISLGKVQFLNMMIEQSPYAISYLAKLPLEELFEIMDEDKIQFTENFERSLYANQVNKTEEIIDISPNDEMMPEEEVEPKEEVKKIAPKEVKKDTPKEKPKEEPKVPEPNTETKPKQEETPTENKTEEPTPPADEIINV